MTRPLSKRAPSASNFTAKNRVWGFFENSNRTRPANRRKPSELRRKIRLTPTKTASGIPYWPSRDPIQERGGLNLYGFVRNDGVNKWDLLGKCTVGEKRMILKVGWYLSLATIEDQEMADQMFALASGIIAGSSIPGAMPGNSWFVKSSMDDIDTAAEILVAAPGVAVSEADAVATLAKYRLYLRDVIGMYDKNIHLKKPLNVIVRWDECVSKCVVFSGWETKRHTYTSTKYYSQSTLTYDDLNKELEKAYDEVEKL